MSSNLVVQIDGARPLTMSGSEFLQLAAAVLEGQTCVMGHCSDGPVTWLNPRHVQLPQESPNEQQWRELNSALGR